jgi:hypothetical protein
VAHAAELLSEWEILILNRRAHNCVVGIILAIPRVKMAFLRGADLHAISRVVLLDHGLKNRRLVAQ